MSEDRIELPKEVTEVTEPPTCHELRGGALYALAYPGVISEEGARLIQDSLAEIKKKWDVDFILLEDGMRVHGPLATRK